MHHPYLKKLDLRFLFIVTMQNLYHDGGFVTAGINEEMIDGLAKLYGDEDK